MKTINRGSIILTKVFEVLHWVMAALMAVGAVCTTTAPQWMEGLIRWAMETGGPSLRTYSFEVVPINAAGEVDLTIVMVFCIGAVVIFLLMAMVFRNLCLILKKAEAQSPFLKDNARMLKEIGIFYMALPVVSTAVGLVLRLTLGDGVEASTDFSYFVTGILVLCLTQYFRYGIRLEEDVEGLV